MKNTHKELCGKLYFILINKSTNYVRYNCNNNNKFIGVLIKISILLQTCV
jgi:hypothetical protein